MLAPLMLTLPPLQKEKENNDSFWIGTNLISPHLLVINNTLCVEHGSLEIAPWVCTHQTENIYEAGLVTQPYVKSNELQ
jgi:hypothetical protein